MWKASLQISLSVMRRKKSHLCPTYSEAGHWMVSELLLPTFEGKIQGSQSLVYDSTEWICSFWTLNLGSVVELPDEYSAWILKGGIKNQSNSDEDKHAKNIAAARTQKLTVWNYDKPGESDNPISRGLQWTKICDAIAVSDIEGDEKENISGEK